MVAKDLGNPRFTPRDTRLIHRNDRSSGHERRSRPRDGRSGARDDRFEVHELKRSLDDWAAISAQMIDLLHDTVACERSRNWQPHLEQIVTAIRVFGDRCQSESREFGRWRADGLELDDVFERVRDQGQRLVSWRQRIMAE